MATNSSRPRRSIGTGAALQPAAADHGLGDARAVAQGAGEVVDEPFGIGIAGMRPDFELPISPARRKNPPMGGVRQIIRLIF